MVLDIEHFREDDEVSFRPPGQGPDWLREQQQKRFKDPAVVDRCVAADKAWRKCDFKKNRANKLKNDISKTIGAKMKAKEPQGDTDVVPEALTKDVFSVDDAAIKSLNVKQLKALKVLLEAAAAENIVELQKQEELRNANQRMVGNVLDPEVPVAQDEKHNAVLRTVPENAAETKKQYSHVDLITMIDGVETDHGVVTAGGRGYYLKGAAVALETALVNYSLNFLSDRGFTAVSPPVFMRKEVMQEVAQLNQFDDELYKVIGKASENEEDTAVDEKYLIATSEQPLCALHRRDWIEKEKFPLRYAGVSECFRQEVGSHGRDTTGIFRVHQFKKIEQFCMTSPHDGASQEMIKEMLQNAEDFLKSIGLGYQVVCIVSGALNLAAAKKWDVEAWFPGSKAFRELVSCSNCTDYQSRRLQIRYGQTKALMGQTEYVHMLNSTLCATTRTICCILESFQVGDFESGGGVVVPEVLRPYMPQRYKEFIPFVNPAPVVEAAKGKGKAKSKGKGKGGKKN